MEPRENIYIGFEIIVFGQILTHKIGVSDLSSPNSQIQLRYTPNTMLIKYGVLVFCFAVCFLFFLSFLALFFFNALLVGAL